MACDDGNLAAAAAFASGKFETLLTLVNCRLPNAVIGLTLSRPTPPTTPLPEVLAAVFSTELAYS